MKANTRSHRLRPNDVLSRKPQAYPGAYEVGGVPESRPLMGWMSWTECGRTALSPTTLHSEARRPDDCSSSAVWSAIIELPRRQQVDSQTTLHMGVGKAPLCNSGLSVSHLRDAFCDSARWFLLS